jgi:hypothetical protein
MSSFIGLNIIAWFKIFRGQKSEDVRATRKVGSLNFAFTEIWNKYCDVFRGCVTNK